MSHIFWCQLMAHIIPFHGKPPGVFSNRRNTCHGFLALTCPLAAAFQVDLGFHHGSCIVRIDYSWYFVQFLILYEQQSDNLHQFWYASSLLDLHPLFFCDLSKFSHSIHLPSIFPACSIFQTVPTLGPWLNHNHVENNTLDDSAVIC